MDKTVKLFLHPFKDGDTCVHYEFYISGRKDGFCDFIYDIVSECASGHIMMQYINYYERPRKIWFFNRKNAVCSAERIKEGIANGEINAVACKYKNVCGGGDEFKYLCVLQEKFEALDKDDLHIEIFADRQIDRTTSDVIDFYRGKNDYMVKIQSEFYRPVGYIDVNTKHTNREEFERIFKKVCESFGFGFEYKHLKTSEVCRTDI